VTNDSRPIPFYEPTITTIRDEINKIEPPSLREKILAERRPDKPTNTGAEKLSEALSLKLTEAAGHIVKELDQLIAEIERIKERVLEDSGHVRGTIDGHFQLVVEALELREKVSKTLQKFTK
jgi:hypothetical protein